jgi:hypothetical protein
LEVALKTNIPFAATLVSGSVVYSSDGTTHEIKNDMDVYVEYV